MKDDNQINFGYKFFEGCAFYCDEPIHLLGPGTLCLHLCKKWAGSKNKKRMSV